LGGGGGSALLQRPAGRRDGGVVYLLAREWFDEATAQVAALITAVAPFHVQYSQETRMYALLTLSLLLTTWAYWRAWQRGHTRYWLAFGVLAGISMYVQQLAAFYLLALGLLPVLARDWRRLLRTALAADWRWGFTCLVVISPTSSASCGSVGPETDVLHFWLTCARSRRSISTRAFGGSPLLAAVLACSDLPGDRSPAMARSAVPGCSRSAGRCGWRFPILMVRIHGVPAGLLPRALPFRGDLSTWRWRGCSCGGHRDRFLAGGWGVTLSLQ
jgi:hypothetical protein